MVTIDYLKTKALNARVEQRNLLNNRKVSFICDITKLMDEAAQRGADFVALPTSVTGRISVDDSVLTSFLIDEFPKFQIHRRSITEYNNLTGKVETDLRYCICWDIKENTNATMP